MNSGFISRLAAPLSALLLAPLLVLLLALPATGLAQTPAPAGGAEGTPPEAATGRSDRALATAHRHMIVAAHPLAAQAGLEVLRAGGNALDAAIATAFVLNVVEPQSSGIGGGGFLVYYDHASGRMTVWDGREIAPAAARGDRFMASGKPMHFLDAVGSGMSVGVPGMVAMLEAAHRDGGRLPWARLLEPAIRAASDGFDISPRLAGEIAEDPLLYKNNAARAFFFDAEGHPRGAGERLFNPQLAAVLRRIAAEGSSALYRGQIAQDMVNAVHAAAVPGDLAESDLAAYTPLRREALCGAYRGYRICGVPPPSSGEVSVVELLDLLARFPMSREAPGSVDAVHLFSEAGRLAYADRDRYLADPAFVPQPVAALLDPAYLARRSQLIDPLRSMGLAQPGTLPGAPLLGEDHSHPQASTTQVSIVDDQGNAVAMTNSVESAFGSRIMVDGFMLNNELTDFSFVPATDGLPAANRVEPGKRPRSSMAPTLVFAPEPGPHDAPTSRWSLRYVLGSPGGPMIINYVAKALVALIDWKMDAQAAAALPNMGSRNRATELEADTPLTDLAGALRARGHEVRIDDQTSGLNIIEVHAERKPHRPSASSQGSPAMTLQGGTDPRREGVALGD